MNFMGDSAFVDTNVVVYAFDDDEPVKQEQAREVLAGSGDQVLVLSTQVLAEFYVTVTRKLARPLDSATARQAVAHLSDLPVVSTDADLVLAAIEVSRRHQLSLWDGLILQAAATADCNVVLTEDLSHGSVIGGVTVVNPFRAGD
jgi:predicted nucleic acid-binding protein